MSFSPVPNNPLGGWYAKIACASSGANVVVPAVTEKRIIGVAYNYMANGTVNVKWQSANTDITGLAYLVANTGKVVNECRVGWFKTEVGEALNLNLSANVAVGGELVYFLI